MAAKDKKNEPLSFEQAIAELEQIVKCLEQDDVNLDDAVNKYQDGMKLLKFCQDKLSGVEQQIKLLDQESGDLNPIKID